MKTLCLAVMIALVIPLELHCEDIVALPVDQAPKFLADSDWVKSADGKVSVYLALDKTTFTDKEKVVLRCFIKNNSDLTLELLKPFGDPLYAKESGLIIMGPKGLVKYHGLLIDYELGKEAFMKIAPKTCVSQTIVLPDNVLDSIVAPGLYTVRYKYRSGSYRKMENGSWTGTIESKTAIFQIERM